jgi:hypothetical protein
MAPRIRAALKHYELRKTEDISWSELGRRVWRLLGEGGDSAKWVSRVKLGRQEPSVAEGGAIAYVLDVSPLWLCWEIGEMGRFPAPAEDTLPIAAALPSQSDAERAASKKPSRRGGRA